MGGSDYPFNTFICTCIVVKLFLRKIPQQFINVFV